MTMEKTHAWPEGHWDWPINLCHKHGVRCGEMIWVGGQVDLTSEGRVCHPGDAKSQTRNAMKNFSRVLEDLDCDFGDLVMLWCFYVSDGSMDEREFLKTVAACLDRDSTPAVTAIPVPALAYDGLQVEIEGCAMRRENGDRIPGTVRTGGEFSPLPQPFSQGVRRGKMIFVSAQSPVDAAGSVLHPNDMVAQTRQVMSQIAGILAGFGATFDDVVKTNRWYSGDAGIDDFEPAALVCAAYFNEPGPAATGIPIPRHADPEIKIRISMIAMLGEDGRHLPRRHVWPDSLWDWHVHLPYQHGLKCEEMIFLGGQVSLDKHGVSVYPGDLSTQTHQAMAHIGTLLNELDAGYDDVCKVTTVYRGECGEEALNANLPIRASYFSDPGPATTGVPLPALAYDNMMVEIDIYAMVEPDRRG